MIVTEQKTLSLIEWVGKFNFAPNLTFTGEDVEGSGANAFGTQSGRQTEYFKRKNVNSLLKVFNLSK
jgi:hypothetical protein